MSLFASSIKIVKVLFAFSQTLKKDNSFEYAEKNKKLIKENKKNETEKKRYN